MELVVTCTVEYPSSSITVHHRDGMQSVTSRELVPGVDGVVGQVHARMVGGHARLLLNGRDSALCEHVIGKRDVGHAWIPFEPALLRA